MSTNHSIRRLLNEKVQIHEDGSKERWRDVVGYQGFYRVSDRGRVESVSRRVPHRGSGYLTIRQRILRMRRHNQGYVAVDFSKSRKLKSFLVHRLVLEAFVGPCPEGMEVCHEDNDKTNNNLGNLRWGTRESNLRDRLFDGRRYKLEMGEVVEIRRLHATGLYSQQEIGNMFKISQVMVSHIVLEQAWRF